MTTWLYDGSFEGLLSAVFDLYWQRKQDIRIRREVAHMREIFEDTIFMPTVIANADRVWEGLRRRLSPVALQQLFACHLAEQQGSEDHIVGYIRHVFASTGPVEGDLGNPHVLYVSRMAVRVYREKHRMEAFVRFRLTKDGIYYAVVAPEYNVLPLIATHFRERYADQRWLIYDHLRRFGIYYNLASVETVRLQFYTDYDERYHAAHNIWAPEEELYQELWQSYYRSAGIAGRANYRLHLRHMPKRYWKYLTEKQEKGGLKGPGVGS